MVLLIDWNDPETSVQVQVWAILSQRPIEWREMLGYYWFQLQCRLQPGYKNWIQVKEWEQSPLILAKMHRLADYA